MATTTPNYGWAVPTSTDLVKDGATAIETLGDAIDASMNTALGTKKAGMVLLNTTSFSAVASQSVNDVFSATYDNYLIELYAEGSGNCALSLRFRASGTDETGSVYDNAVLYQSSSTPTAADSQNETSILLGSTSTFSNHYGTFTTMRPNLVDQTLMIGNFSNWSTTAQRVALQSNIVQTTTQYTGFTIFTSANTVTGKVVVYGLNQ
jgi:mevalonate kinase